MAIEGLVGFRTNRFVPGENIFSSPRVISGSQEWEWTEKVMWATCETCPVDEEGHLILNDWHTCGIYATYSPDVLYMYMGGYRVPLLVEALGYATLRERGFTASGALIVAAISMNHSQIHRDDKTVVSAWDSYYRDDLLRIAAFAKRWNVPIISFEEAMDIVRIKAAQYYKGLVYEDDGYTCK